MPTNSASDAPREATWVFDVSIDLDPSLDRDACNHFWDAFISEAIEASNVRYGGLSEGVAESCSEAVAAAAHSAVTKWLASRKEVATFSLGQVERDAPSDVA